MSDDVRAAVERIVRAVIATGVPALYAELVPPAFDALGLKE
jgi:hypothetical protein